MNKKIKFIKRFGIYLFIIKALCKITKKYKRINNFFSKIKHKIIMNKLETIEKNIVDCFKDNLQIKKGKNIWVMWWQGIENAPEIVKMCYKKLKKYSNDVVLITSENYKQYIHIEDCIIEKYEKNIISIQSFSDIIRMKLLAKYGGYWVDSTIYVSSDIFKKIKKQDYFSTKYETKNYKYISRGRWSIFFMAGQKTNLFRFAEMCLCEYWKKENIMIDYFLTDYIIELGYRKIKTIKKQIDENKYNNINIYELNRIKNNKYNEKEIHRLFKTNQIHKLSYKDFINYDDYNNVYNYLKK